MSVVKRQFAVTIALALIPLSTNATAHAKTLEARTIAAFDEYVARVETDLQKRLAGSEADFLAVSRGEEWRDSLRAGDINTEFVEDSLEAPGGLIQDWIATMFVPGVTAEDAIDLLTDYDHHAGIYEEVLSGRVLSRNDGAVRSQLRIRKKKIITIVLDTEHEMQVVSGGNGRWQLRSRSTRINQVRDAGESSERLLPEGEDGGYLWRINAYWSILEVPGGIYVQCRTTTLTRGIPLALGWVINGFIRTLPRDSLVAMLTATRGELLRRAE